MTLAIALAIVLVGSTLILVYQWATGMLAPRDPIDDLPPLPDTWHGFWPKGPHHE